MDGVSWNSKRCLHKIGSPHWSWSSRKCLASGDKQTKSLNVKRGEQTIPPDPKTLHSRSRRSNDQRHWSSWSFWFFFQNFGAFEVYHISYPSSCASEQPMLYECKMKASESGGRSSLSNSSESVLLSIRTKLSDRLNVCHFPLINYFNHATSEPPASLCTELFD